MSVPGWSVVLLTSLSVFGCGATAIVAAQRDEAQAKLFKVQANYEECAARLDAQAKKYAATFNPPDSEGIYLCHVTESDKEIECMSFQMWLKVLQAGQDGKKGRK